MKASNSHVNKACREDFIFNYAIPTVVYFIVWAIIALICYALKTDAMHFLLASILNGTGYYLWLKKLNNF